MVIQPVQPVLVTIKWEQECYEGLMVSLTENQLEISCAQFLEKNLTVLFQAKYFRGTAVITDTKFEQLSFNYILEINHIQFQPGLLINTRL